jgi:hypothetical protein
MHCHHDGHLFVGRDLNMVLKRPVRTKWRVRSPFEMTTVPNPATTSFASRRQRISGHKQGWIGGVIDLPVHLHHVCMDLADVFVNLADAVVELIETL